MKKSFTLLELIFVLVLISIVFSFFYFKPSNNNLDLVANRLVLYLKQTRYQSLIDNKYNEEDSLWHKKRWTLKFFRCKSSVGGIYYSIYSDENRTGHPSLNESLKDPLTNLRVYSTNNCEETNKTSSYVLLTKKFDITEITLSCNMTSSLGQLSFASDGKVYGRLSANENEDFEYEIEDKCILTLKDNLNNTKSISIESKTGFIQLVNN